MTDLQDKKKLIAFLKRMDIETYKETPSGVEVTFQKKDKDKEKENKTETQAVAKMERPKNPYEEANRIYQNAGFNSLNGYPVNGV